MSDPLEGLRKTVASISVSPSSIKEAIVETCSIIVADLETGEIYYATGVAERMFGYLIRGELKGMNVDQLVPDDVRPQHPAHRARYAEDQRMRPMGSRGKALQAKRKDGTSFLVAIGLHAAVIESKRCVIVTVMDVT